MRMLQTQLLKAGFREAEAITKKYAKTFYFASHFLNKEKRYASYAVYAICRISDEAVDNTLASIDSIKRINEKISCAYSGMQPKEPLLSAFRETLMKYAIPKSYFDELLSGMRMDLEKKRYVNFNELYDYCYKVAGVIGLIMLEIFGYKDTRAKKYAVELGIAMQLTNILRDIKEDFLRNRIYLPEDEMRKFGVSEEEISRGSLNNAFKELLKFEIERARKYYESSRPGINMITDANSRLVTTAMKEMYSGILVSIEKNNYDVFSKRAHLNYAQKINTVVKILLRR